MSCAHRLARCQAALAVGAALVLASASASAQTGDAGLAEMLFQQARTLLGAGRTSEACEKFAESQRIDPATGTLLNLATCRESEGKLASAWADFKAAEDSARRDGREDRVRFAREHLAAIQPRLSYVTVQVAPGSRIAGLEVRLDDAPVREAVWGVATPVDSGSHAVTATAPGRPPFIKRFDVGADGLRVSVDVRLQPAPGTGASRPAVADTTLPLRSTAATDQSDSLSTAGWVIGGIGVAGLVTGAAFGALAFIQWSDRNEWCKGEICDDKRGVDLGDKASRSATISNIAFAVGLAGAGVGGYLLFVRSPPASDRPAPVARRRVTPLLAPGTAGLTLGGSW